MTDMKQKFYDLTNILDKEAQYNIIIGERSNGKTYAVLLHGVKSYAKTGSQMAIVRRWRDDFVGKRGATMFNALVDNGEIKKATKNEWTDVYYFSSRWYFCRYDENGNRETCETPFAYGFSLSGMEHDKSTSYPRITTILFDEFVSRSGYLPDEFSLFMNTISTIVRNRKQGIKIFMCGNTVSKYCPYFGEMGLKHIKEMKQGDIDLYTYGDSDLRVAVEFCKPNKSGKDSDVFFAFDNPRLKMISSGVWEVGIYPHCPTKIRPKDIVFTYYIIFDTDVCECNVVLQENKYFTFIHRKTSELKSPDEDLIYSTQFDARPNWRRKITIPRSDLERRIAEFYIKDKIFYDSNETGEIIRNYLMWCGKEGV